MYRAWEWHNSRCIQTAVSISDLGSTDNCCILCWLPQLLCHVRYLSRTRLFNSLPTSLTSVLPTLMLPHLSSRQKLVRIHVHTHVHARTTHTHICMHTHTCMDVHLHVYVCTHIYICFMLLWRVQCIQLKIFPDTQQTLWAGVTISYTIWLCTHT